MALAVSCPSLAYRGRVSRMGAGNRWPSPTFWLTVIRVLRRAGNFQAKSFEGGHWSMVPSHDKGEKAPANSAEASVTQWIAGLKARKAEAADRLWNRYFERLVRLARKKLGSAPRRAADEEDVAAIVFRNLWQGAEAARFPELRNRENLWPLLVVLTSRARARRCCAQKEAGQRRCSGRAGPNHRGGAYSRVCGHDDRERVAAVCRLDPCRSKSPRASWRAGKRRDRPRAWLRPADGGTQVERHPPDLGRESVTFIRGCDWWKR